MSTRALSPCLPARQRRGESGQALVEFAIVAPLIVLVLLFALWFYELIFVRLKAQEAARYAAWEATAYKLHDYEKGPSALSNLATSMASSVMTDTMTRYSDLNSAKNSLTTLGVQHTLFAASWVQPVVIVTNHSEEQVPGGWIPNTLLSVAGNLFDWLSALNYKDMNPIAVALIGAGKAGQGQALTHRMFGNPQWGFNTRGYAEARVGILVTNNFFNRGVGSFLVSHNAKSFMIWERHGVLADSWRLDDGADVYGSEQKPGVSKKSAYWKQVERMYFMNQAARGVAKTKAALLYAAGVAALGAALAPATPDLNPNDFTEPVVVSRSYGGSGYNAGKVSIRQDRPSFSERYDTVPATSTEGDEIKEYGKTLQKRGKYFMGCQTEMQLGCPSSTLQKDNPFGSYVVRE